MKNPQTILITGATSGIGFALAEHYAQKGITLFLTGRDTNRLKNIKNICQKQGTRVFTKSVDVTEKAKLQKWLLECDIKSPIDLIIANAGVSSSSVGEQTGLKALALQQKVFDINLQGTFNTIFPLIPKMQTRGHGQIALMSSMASFQGLGRSPAYSASKAAIRVYAEGMNVRWNKSGINFCAICPGFIKTPLTDKNKFHMPFLIDATKSAKIIAKALAKNKPLIAFVWQMRFICWILNILPATLRYKLLAKTT